MAGDSITGGGVGKPIGNTGNAPIIRVGHTYDNAFGPEPLAMAKGVAAGKPTDEIFK